jgi:hypothetical protein
MTSSNTDAWLVAVVGSCVNWTSPTPVSEPLSDVCCKIEILAGIGVPGISFWAIAFRIAIQYVKSTCATTVKALGGLIGISYILDLPVPFRPIKA